MKGELVAHVLLVSSLIDEIKANQDLDSDFVRIKGLVRDEKLTFSHLIAMVSLELKKSVFLFPVLMTYIDEF